MSFSDGCASCRLPRADAARPTAVDVRIERLSADDVLGLGGPDGAAAHVRSLVPDGASVSDQGGEVIPSVRAAGEAPALDYTRRFDTAGNQPRPLHVADEELDAAIKRVPMDTIAGLQVSITNVAL